MFISASQGQEKNMKKTTKKKKKSFRMVRTQSVAVRFS